MALFLVSFLLVVLGAGLLKRSAPSEPSPSPSRRVSLWYGRVLVAVFALGICSPLLDFRFDLDPGLELSENRPSALAPAWPKSIAEWQALPPALQSYWNDAFGFRRRLLHWNSVIQFAFGVSPTPNVVIGKDGWLFYDGMESFEQHRGARPFSEAGLRNWAEQLEARRQWLASRGAHYLFVIAPDKQTIYSDKVPGRYGPFARTPTDQLVPYLRAHTQVDVLDLRDPLRVARAAGDVFAKTDSHWNDRGEFAAYTAIATRLQAWYPQMAVRPQSSFIRSPMPRWNADLSLMLPGLYGALTDGGEQWQPTPPLAAQPSYIDGLCPPESKRYVLLATPSRPDLPRAVIFHDSYLLAPDERIPLPPPRGALAPPNAAFRLSVLLGELFSRSAFSWQYEFNLQILEHEHPDVVIQQCVERTLSLGPQGALLPVTQ